MPCGLDTRILDVGCGAGHLLSRLQRDGFRSLQGIDPYIAETLAYPGGLTVKKQGVEALAGEFDLIMLNHSFEHMNHPHQVLARLVRHLADNGRLLIRIPLAGSYAWRKYGTSWANLDAPRHLFLYTPSSLSLLAASAGMAIESILYESQYKQVALSEWISLGGTMRTFDSQESVFFTAAEHKALKRMALGLNAQRDGDGAAFILARCQDDPAKSRQAAKDATQVTPLNACATSPDRGRAERARSLENSQFHSRSLAFFADSLRSPG